MAQAATVSTIAEEAHDARWRSEQYVRCRTFGHAWYDVDSTWKSSLGVALTLRCERCGTERHDSISRSSGALVSRGYVYATDYQYGRDEVPTREDFRRMLLARRVAEARAARRARAS